MLGSPAAIPVGGYPVTLPTSGWMLIGFLMTAPRREASRDAAAAALWPEQGNEAARRCLATTLWRTRAAFGEADCPVGAGASSVTLRFSRGIWTDALALERRALAALQQPPPEGQARGRLRRTLLACTGEFLQGVDAEWALLERERLRCLRLDALYALAAAYARDGAWTSVVATARPLCAAEPLREDAHRMLMLGYARSGNRGLALRQFQACAAILAEELGVEPMEETIALHRRLAGGGSAPAPDESRPAVPRDSPGSMRAALLATRQSICAALGSIDRALADF